MSCKFYVPSQNCTCSWSIVQLVFYAIMILLSQLFCSSKYYLRENASKALRQIQCVANFMQHRQNWTFDLLLIQLKCAPADAYNRDRKNWSVRQINDLHIWSNLMEQTTKTAPAAPNKPQIKSRSSARRLLSLTLWSPYIFSLATMYVFAWPTCPPPQRPRRRCY